MEFQGVVRLSIEKTVDGGRWTVDGGRWTVDGGRFLRFVYFSTIKIIIMGKFKELRVWQESIELVADIYKITRKGLFARDFGLANQIQRASVSIASNIAEGDERRTNKEAIHFFNISKGSAAEVTTQLIIAQKIGYINIETLTRLENKAHKINAMLKKLIYARNKN